MIIRCRAPVRISFAGGGTDVSPYTEENGGLVVNAAINKYAFATLILRDDGRIILESSDFKKRITFTALSELEYDGILDLHKSVIRHFKKEGIELFLRCDAPPRSGLGSSATAFVSVIGLFNYLNGSPMTDYEIAELAYELERHELKNHGGRQDQYSAVFGGINFMEFKGNDFVRINPLRMKKSTLHELEKNLVIANIGHRGKSGDIIADQNKKYQRKEMDVVKALENNKRYALLVKEALLKGNLQQFGEIMHHTWQEKKKYSPLVSNERIDRLYRYAREAGALGGKVSGAGGGGHMFFYCRPNTEQRVADVLERESARIVPFTFDFKGLTTWEVDNDKRKDR